MGTFVQELRIVLMFLVWMRDLNWVFPYPTRTPQHKHAVYFRVGHITVHDTWMISTMYWRKRDLSPASEVCLLFGFFPHTVGCVCSEETFWLEGADVGALTAVASCSWVPSFCEEKHLSHGFLLWKEDNEYRQIWCFRINYCNIIISNVQTRWDKLVLISSPKNPREFEIRDFEFLSSDNCLGCDREHPIILECDTKARATVYGVPPVPAAWAGLACSKYVGYNNPSQQCLDLQPRMIRTVLWVK